MRMLALAPLLLLFLGQEPEERYDLRVRAAGEPILVSYEAEWDGSYKGEVQGSEVEVPLKGRTEILVVDEYTVVDDGAGHYEANRTYVKFWDEVNDEVQDPELNGLRVDFVKKDGEIRCDLGGRLARKESLDKAMNQFEFDSFGLWVPLPEAAEIGETFEVDATGLLYLLVDAEGELSRVSSRMTLQSVSEAGIAKLEGRIYGAESVKNQDAGSLDGTYDGACTLTIDTTKQLVTHVEWKGEARASGTGPAGDFAAQMTFDIKVEAERGPAAERARKKKPVYRSVPRHPEGIGLAFELPSHWFEVDVSDVPAYQTSIHGAENFVSVEARSYPIDPGAIEQVIADVAAKLQADYDDFKERKMKSPLGKGRSLRFQSEGQEFLVELYPLGERRLTMLRLFGPPEAFAKEAKAWSKVRKSLREE